jgi:hypothetical protein
MKQDWAKVGFFNIAFCGARSVGLRIWSGALVIYRIPLYITKQFLVSFCLFDCSGAGWIYGHVDRDGVFRLNGDVVARLM